MRVCYILRHPERHFYSIERLCHVLASAMQDHAEVSIYTMPFASSIFGAPANLLRLPRAPGTIYHVVGDVHYAALALPWERTIITYHDAVSLHRLSGVKRHLVLEYSYRRPMECAGAVTTISQFAKSELEKACNGLNRPVHVVHNPADPVFAGVEPHPSGGRPSILQIGSLPHKNVDTVVRALAGLDCDLHIVGSPERHLSELASALGVRVEWHTGISDRELIELYAVATVVTFASAYEGFGFPIIEAQAVGCPVITSKCCSLPEVAGDGALFVEPRNVDALRSAIRQVLNDSELRSRLIELGRRNVERFNVSTIAAEYLAVYRSLVN
jgi:glycosyltransferase involved in cell wall biosynthesis